MDKFDQIERVHLYACKRVLHVLDKTPNDIVYGELGRYPLWVTSISKSIKYWFCLLKQPENLWSNLAYNMSLGLHEKGYVTWVTRIKQSYVIMVLNRCGCLAVDKVLSLRSSGKDSTVPFVTGG